MAIGVSNFQILTPQQANPGMSQLRQAILAQNQRLANQKAIATLPYAAPQAQSNLLRTQLSNQLTQATLPYAAPTAAANLDELQQNNKLIGPKAAALIALQQQQAAEAGQETLADRIKNQYLAQSTQADIGLKNAQANFYNQGGKGTAPLMADKQAIQQVKLDNPNLNSNQLREALNAYQTGQTTLSDGTKLAPPSSETLKWLAISNKYGTTAPILTKDIQSRQAEAEINAIAPIAQQDIAPYGNTWFGYSPQQLLDTFNPSDDAQTRLGKLAAGTAAQYELAQQRIRLAQGQPGVTSTKELMDLSQQYINAHYPHYTEKARKVASDELERMLNAGLSARESVGASAAYVPQYASSSSSSNQEPDFINVNGVPVPNPKKKK